MTIVTRAVRRFSRNRKGSVYIELVAALILLTGVFIGSAVVAAKTIDFDRQTRAAHGGADLTWILDRDSAAPGQSDFDIIGQKMIEVAGIEPAEDFQMYFTVVEYDHTGAGLRIDWQGSYGTTSALGSKVSVSEGLLTVNGYNLTVRDDERLVIVEFYRTRRGLFVDLEAPLYNFAVSYRADPVHA